MKDFYDELMADGRILRFKKKRHSYHIISDKQDFWLPSTTKILGIIDKGSGMKQFLKDAGSNSDFIMRVYGTFGDIFHNIVDQAQKNGEVILTKEILPNYPEEQMKDWIWERLLRFKDYWDTEQDRSKLISSEKKIYNLSSQDSNLWHAGMTDKLHEIDGNIVIDDWKTGNGVYEEYWMQLASYAKAIEYMYGIEVDKIRVCWFPAEKPNKKGYRIIEKTKKEIDIYYKMFMNAFELWNFLARPKILADQEQKQEIEIKTYMSSIQLKLLN